jgi:hypothetical protein
VSVARTAVAVVRSRVEIIRNCPATVSGVRRGEGVLYQLLGSGKNPTIQPYLMSFQPGGGYERDLICHPGEEFAWIGAATLPW